MTEAQSHDVTRECLYGAACHEAGHAVALFLAAQRLNLPARDVLIGMRVDKNGDGFLLDFHGRRMDDNVGLITAASIWTDKLKFFGNMSRDEKKQYAETLEMHALFLLSGPYAEATNRRGLSSASLDIDKDTGRVDLRAVNKVSKVISSFHLPHSFFPARSCIQLRMEARAIVRHNWTTIESIGARLYEKGELSGHEAYDIFAATCAKQAA